MASEASEQMMALLQELAVLKKLDKEYEADPSNAAAEQHRLRQKRHNEIAQEIRALGQQEVESDKQAE